MNYPTRGWAGARELSPCQLVLGVFDAPVRRSPQKASFLAICTFCHVISKTVVHCRIVFSVRFLPRDVGPSRNDHAPTACTVVRQGREAVARRCSSRTVDEARTLSPHRAFVALPAPFWRIPPLRRAWRGVYSPGGWPLKSMFKRASDGRTRQAVAKSNAQPMDDG